MQLQTQYYHLWIGTSSRNYVANIITEGICEGIELALITTVTPPDTSGDESRKSDTEQNVLIAKINELDAAIKTFKEKNENTSKGAQQQQPQMPFWHPMMNMPRMIQYPFKDMPNF